MATLQIEPGKPGFITRTEKKIGGKLFHLILSASINECKHFASKNIEATYVNSKRKEVPLYKHLIVYDFGEHSVVYGNR